jgi:hypothetical protein
MPYPRWYFVIRYYSTCVTKEPYIDGQCRTTVTGGIVGPYYWNADAGQTQLATSQNDDGGKTFSWHSGIPAFTYDLRLTPPAAVYGSAGGFSVHHQQYGHFEPEFGNV